MQIFTNRSKLLEFVNFVFFNQCAPLSALGVNLVILLDNG